MRGMKFSSCVELMLERLPNMFSDHRELQETPKIDACAKRATKVCLAQKSIQTYSNIFCDVNHSNIAVTPTAWKEVEIRIELLAVASMYAANILQGVD